MKKFSKIFIAAMCITIALSSCVFAKFGEITTTPQAPGNSEGNITTLLGIIQWVGYIIAIGMLVYVGVKYVTASANEKADLKNAMVKYVVGALLIAGATTIVTWVFNSGIF